MWRSSPISPWKSGSLSPASTVTHFFGSLMPLNQQTKWPGSSLNLQFNEIIVMSPGGSIPSSEPRPPGQQSIRTQGQEAKISLVGSRVSSDHLFLLLDTWTLESWLWEEYRHMLDADSEYKQPSRETCPSPARYDHCRGARFATLKCLFGMWIILS